MLKSDFDAKTNNNTYTKYLYNYFKRKIQQRYNIKNHVEYVDLIQFQLNKK